MFEDLENLLNKISEQIPAISIAVNIRGNMAYNTALGNISECNIGVTRDTLFDIASMTKILSGITFMKLVEQGAFRLDGCVCEYFPELNTVKDIEKDGRIIGKCDCSKITWYNVLTHTTGMGWTRPKTRPSLPHLNKGTEDIFNLPMAYQTGEHIVYSDIPIILMGKAMEIKMNAPLDELIYKYITEPLNLYNTKYLRLNSDKDLRMIVPTEYDCIFRKCRIHGVVHDENAYLLDGVAAHAGIFSTAEDMCRLCVEFMHCLKTNGILETATACNMIKEHESENGDRRGLVWQLSSQTENASSRFLSKRAFGHSGFTGCFAWADPDTETVLVFLSNDIYNGRENRCLTAFKEKIIYSVMA